MEPMYSTPTVMHLWLLVKPQQISMCNTLNVLNWSCRWLRPVRRDRGEPWGASPQRETCKRPAPTSSPASSAWRWAALSCFHCEDPAHGSIRFICVEHDQFNRNITCHHKMQKNSKMHSLDVYDVSIYSKWNVFLFFFCRCHGCCWYGSESP